jgi:hypothetical protein
MTKKLRDIVESRPTGAGYVDMPHDYYKPHEPAPKPAVKKVVKKAKNALKDKPNA